MPHVRAARSHTLATTAALAALAATAPASAQTRSQPETPPAAPGAITAFGSRAALARYFDSVFASTRREVRAEWARE